MKDLPTLLDEYLATRRALGAALVDAEHMLRSFLAFLRQHAAVRITTQLALQWATEPSQAQPAWHARRLGTVRAFARYASAEDPRHEVPPEVSVRASRERWAIEGSGGGGKKVFQNTGHAICVDGRLWSMQSAAQREVTGSGAGASGQGEPGQPFAAQVVDLKWRANYWRSQHARAKERIAAAQAQGKRTQQELAEARRQMRGLQQQVQALERENAGLRQEVEGLQRENRQLRQTPFRKRSEKGEGRGRDGGAGGQSEPEAGRSAGGKRRRGGQPGGVAHPRADHSGLEVLEEVHEPEAGSCRCPDCGLPYRRNGEERHERIEIEVQGHTRRIRRPRYRAACACARRQGKAVPEVIAPLPPTLFRGTSYGLSVWVGLLIQVYWQRRPVRAFEREWADCGVRLPAGTMLGHVGDFLTWFEPLETAVEAHQQQALFVHGDETSWVVHVWGETGGNPRGWLWVCVSADAVRFRVDRSRSAEAAAKLFGRLGLAGAMVLVCDRYSAYVRLAREHAGQFVLAICWVHVRRDYWQVGRSRPDLQEWTDGMVERIGTLYRLNAERLAAWDPQRPLEGQSPEFQAAHTRLQEELDALFAWAQRELDALTAASQKAPPPSAPDPRRKPLQSMLKHRAGLEVFLARPGVPLDNNVAERALRRPVIGRKLSFGSHSEDGAALQALLLSVFATLDMAGVNLWRWLEEFLGECAAIGRQAVVADPQAWLPWGMSAERLAALQAPRGRALDGPAP